MRECKKEGISLASLVYKVMWLIVQERLVKVVEERQGSKVVLGEAGGVGTRSCMSTGHCICHTHTNILQHTNCIHAYMFLYSTIFKIIYRYT